MFYTQIFLYVCAFISFILYFLSRPLQASCLAAGVFTFWFSSKDFTIFTVTVIHWEVFWVHCVVAKHVLQLHKEHVTKDKNLSVYLFVR